MGRAETYVETLWVRAGVEGGGMDGDGNKTWCWSGWSGRVGWDEALMTRKPDRWGSRVSE